MDRQLQAWCATELNSGDGENDETRIPEERRREDGRNFRFAMVVSGGGLHGLLRGGVRRYGYLVAKCFVFSQWCGLVKSCRKPFQAAMLIISQ